MIINEIKLIYPFNKKAFHLEGFFIVILSIISLFVFHPRPR